MADIPLVGAGLRFNRQRPVPTSAADKTGRWKYRALSQLPSALAPLPISSLGRQTRVWEVGHAPRP
jgi:hypothetical protein